MTKDELNSFIGKYAQNNNAKTAMMLTGEWGIGKTYYIEHFLIPYLTKREIRTIVISLYGISTIEDLSKQIYLHLRLPILTKKSEAKEYISIIGYNVASNVMSFKGVSFDISDKQLKKLYESVNIKGIFLIFEDIERSSIDVLTLLGFVNAIVEHDGAKVLLVANEEQIMEDKDTEVCSCKESGEIKENSDNRHLARYRKEKEKTIGDTIRFNLDIIDSVKNIIADYPDDLVKTLSQEELQRIKAILINSCNSNLRLLIYALQKFRDIFPNMNDIPLVKDDFYYVAFEGLLYLSGKAISSDLPTWEGSQYISTQIEGSAVPVFRFVYDYLKWNVIDEEDIRNAVEEYKKFCFFDIQATRENDQDLYVINNFHIQREIDVRNALENIEKKIKSIEYVGIYAYERLGYLVIQSGDIIGYDSDKICNTMIDNAREMCRSKQISSEDVIWNIAGSSLENEHIQRKYNEFIKKLSEAIEGQKEDFDVIGFSYNPEDISEFYKKCAKNKGQYVKQHRFISLLSLSKIVAMLEKSSSEQINDFRGILFVFYRYVQKNDYDVEDRKQMIKLLELLEEKKLNQACWDKIQLMQINYLKSNLEEFIKKMS